MEVGKVKKDTKKRKPAAGRSRKANIAIVNVGGTFSMATGPQGQRQQGGWKGLRALLDRLRRKGCESITDRADFTIEDVTDADSGELNPKNWEEIIQAVKHFCQSEERFDGIVVLHGTDTLHYSAGATALECGRQLPLPVVFTGAMRPLVDFGSDGATNVEDAVQTIIDARALHIREVMVVFDGKVFRAVRTIKGNPDDFDAFLSPNFPPLGTITPKGVVFSARVFRANGSGNFEISSSRLFDPAIRTFDLHPGFEPSILTEAVRSKTCSGIVLCGFGSGGVKTNGIGSLIPVIRTTVNAGLPVVLTKQCVGGATDLETYETGRRAKAAGAIATGDMTLPMTQVKFMWLLGQGYTADQIRRLMLVDFVGELSNGESS